MNQTSIHRTSLSRSTFCTLLLSCLWLSSAWGAGIEDCQEHVKYGLPSPGPQLLCRQGYALSMDARLGASGDDGREGQGLTG